MIQIREIHEDDVEAVIDLYKEIYGEAFPFKEFYDAHWIKKGVFSDDIIWLVAERKDDQTLVGSAAVMLNAGDHDDLIGEFGRLVVSPRARGMGVATKLAEARLVEARKGCEFIFAECRTAHVGAQKIAERSGFAVIGFCPEAYQLGESRESVALVAQHFNYARRLRKNNPRVIPEVHGIGAMALINCGFEDDLIVDRQAEPYPVSDADDLALEPLRDTQAYRLLRLGRDAGQGQEVFGKMRLEYGFLRVKAHDAAYLVLKRGEAIVAGLGYTWDEIDSKVRIFELLAVDEVARGTLLERAMDWLDAEHEPFYVTVDVNAHGTRAQQTLSLLGFVPVAYAPAMVFQGGERLDIVRMARVAEAPDFAKAELTESATAAMRLVRAALEEKATAVSVDEQMTRLRLFAGLSHVQLARLRMNCQQVSYETGDAIDCGDDAADGRKLCIVLEGAAEVRLNGEDEPVATVRAGDIFGHAGLIATLPSASSITAAEPTRLLEIGATALTSLTRRDPHLGMVLYRNLARVLAERVRDTADRLDLQQGKALRAALLAELLA